MFHDGLHKPFPQAAPAMVFKDENITQPGKSGIIGNYTGKPDLFTSLVNTKTQRVLDGSLNDLQRATLCPVGALTQVLVDAGDIEPGFVCADGVIVTVVFEGVHGSLIWISMLYNNAIASGNVNMAFWMLFWLGSIW